ncbi:MAG: hypothetical protein QHH75_05345 [Bacillota bacterium]|nr:hypothetical protein [Bacillota bacterium]
MPFRTGVYSLNSGADIFPGSASSPVPGRRIPIAGSTGLRNSRGDPARGVLPPPRPGRDGVEDV